MKKQKIILAIAVVSSIAFASCTDNARSRRLTAPMPEGYIPQTKIFKESSSMGVWEGTVKFIESR